MATATQTMRKLLNDPEQVVKESLVGLAAAHGERGVRLLVMTDVATNYLTLVGVLRQLETVRAIAAAQDETLRLVRARQRAGLATPFDVEVVNWLAPLVPAFKIASGDNDFTPMLRAVAAMLSLRWFPRGSKAEPKITTERAPASAAAPICSPSAASGTASSASSGGSGRSARPG